MTELRFLGYIIDQNGLRADSEKIKPIQDFATPKNVKDVRRLIGMASWYRRFIKNFSGIVAPLTELTKTKNVQAFKWTDKAETAFQNLKTALCSYPILRSPDFEKPFIVQTDASDFALGAALIQLDSVRNRVSLAKIDQDAEKLYCYRKRMSRSHKRSGKIPRLSRRRPTIHNTNRSCQFDVFQKFQKFIQINPPKGYTNGARRCTIAVSRDNRLPNLQRIKRPVVFRVEKQNRC